MTRLLDFVIFFCLILCALAVVESQYVWRETYNDLYQAEKQAKQYEIEYEKLGLEQSTQAKHSRVEAFATTALQMQVPDDSRVQVVEVR